MNVCVCMWACCIYERHFPLTRTISDSRQYIHRYSCVCAYVHLAVWYTYTFRTRTCVCVYVYPSRTHATFAQVNTHFHEGTTNERVYASNAWLVIYSFYHGNVLSNACPYPSISATLSSCQIACRNNEWQLLAGSELSFMFQLVKPQQDMKLCSSKKDFRIKASESFKPLSIPWRGGGMPIVRGL